MGGHNCEGARRDDASRVATFEAEGWGDITRKLWERWEPRWYVTFISNSHNAGPPRACCQVGVTVKSFTSDIEQWTLPTGEACL